MCSLCSTEDLSNPFLLFALPFAFAFAMAFAFAFAHKHFVPLVLRCCM